MLRRALTSTPAVLLGALVLTLLAAVLANAGLELWHASGDTARLDTFLQRAPELFVLNSLVVWLLVVLVVAAVGRLWLGLGIVAVLVGLVGYAHRTKLQLRLEPLFPSDLVVATDGDFLLAMVAPSVVLLAVAVTAAVLAGAVAVGRLARRWGLAVDRDGRGRTWAWWGGRATVVALVLATAVGGLQFHEPGNRLKDAYESLGAHWRPWHPKQNYTRNGFVAGMLFSLPARAMARPPGYGEEAMRRLLEKYAAAAARTNRGRDPDALNRLQIVSVLDEALSDPTRYRPVRLEEDPMPFLRDLMRRWPSGNLLTPQYGGGTADVEFELLTGMSTALLAPQISTPFTMLVPRFREFPSVLRLLESRGMRTAALHSYTSDLYRRPEVYRALGFDTALFEDAMGRTWSVGRSDFVSDAATFAEVLRRVREAEAPGFTHVVTMQNHFPTAGRYVDPIPSSGMTNPEDEEHLEHYARGLRHTDEALEHLVAALDRLRRPVVLLVYGDHLPALWHHTPMSPRMRHETPFVVYRNFGPAPARETLPTTSPMHLVNHVLEIADAPVSPYYALLAAVEDQVPAMWQGFVIGADDTEVPWSQLPARAREVLHDYRLVQYDLTEGEHFTADAMFAVPRPDAGTVEGCAPSATSSGSSSPGSGSPSATSSPGWSPSC